MEPIITVFFILVLRLGGPIYCGLRADKLNRNVTGWAIIGLIFPIISIIIISCLSPLTKWHAN
jgi:hypothetical protein